MLKKYDSLILTSYKITFNPADLDAENGITPEIRIQLDKVLKKLFKRVKNLNKEIEILIEKYPHIPQFKNYLSSYYSQIGQHERAVEINSNILKEHPGYLFGRINLAMEYLRKKEFTKIPEILGDAMELKSLYPERDTFHIEEVMSFYQVAVFYFIETGNIEAAEMRLKIMTELDNDNVKTAKAAEKIAMYKFRKELLESLKRVTSAAPDSVSKRKYNQTKKKPVFANPEITLLYQHGFQIDLNIINDLLKLPKESLIEDLKKVIGDGISRYRYFSEETDWDFNTHSFVLHAFFMLSELEADTALDAVLDFLRQDHKLIDYWLSDTLTQDIWEIVFALGQNRLEDLKNYMLEEGNFAYARTEVCQAVTQVALHFPERRTEVLHWYNSVLNYFIENKENEALIDPTLIDLMVSDLVDLNAIELEETIIKLYESEITETECAGELTDVMKKLHSKRNNSDKRKLQTLEEVYKDFSNWERSIERNSRAKSIEEKKETVYPELPEMFKNIGRNEKCPCGSGLKFKKCHGK